MAHSQRVMDMGAAVPQSLSMAVFNSLQAGVRQPEMMGSIEVWMRPPAGVLSAIIEETYRASFSVARFQLGESVLLLLGYKSRAFTFPCKPAEFPSTSTHQPPSSPPSHLSHYPT